MIEVSFSAATVSDIHATMREFLGGKTSPSEAAVEPKASKKTAPTEPTTVTTPAASAAAEKPVEGVIPYATIADLIPKLVSKHGKPKVVALLGTFGVKNGKELQAAQYGEFVTKANAELPLV